MKLLINKLKIMNHFKINAVKQIVLFTVVVLVSFNINAKTKIIKNKDHVGLFVKFDKVTEIREEVVNQSGGTDVVINVNCTGNGDMRCQTDLAIPIFHDNGYELTAAEYNLIDELDSYASAQVLNGNSNGNYTNHITISYPNGTVITYYYKVSWSLVNGVLVFVIEEL
jgi:hypothetical protein